MSDESPPGELSAAERRSLALGRFLNENPTAKRLQTAFHRQIGRRWARFAIGRAVYADGAEHAIDPPADRGVLLAINHRSFFDNFVVSLALYEIGAQWMRSIYYPVRANFFYERPAGVAVNLLVGGGALYPPIFRDPGKAPLNKDAIDRLARALAEPGTLVGLHPEGRRSKSDDPYTLLPAQPGAGQLALQARPTVIPAFVNGMGNSVVQSVADSWSPEARRRTPIIVVFGPAVAYDDLATQKPRAALYKKLSDRMRDAITALGPRERELRAQAERGELPDGDPGWIVPQRWPTRPG